MIVPVMAISNLVLTQQIYSEETNGAHAHYREPVPLNTCFWTSVWINCCTLPKPRFIQEWGIVGSLRLGKKCHKKFMYMPKMECRYDLK